MLSTHWLPHHRDATDKTYFAELRPQFVKVVWSGTEPPYSEDLPSDATYIYRDWTFEYSDLRGVAAEIGRQHAAQMHASFDYLRARDMPAERLLFEGINEPQVWTPLQAPPLVATYYRAFLDGVHGFGGRAVVGNFGVGWPANNGPDTPPDWAFFQPVFDAMLPGDYLGLHEYWADQGCGEMWRWWAGRCLQCPAQVPMLITECGIDSYVKAMVPPRRGWQDMLPGSDFDAKADRYVSELWDYMGRLAADGRIKAILPFTYDIGASEWEKFDIKNEPFKQAVRRKLAQEPQPVPVPWVPGEPPAPPPDPPPAERAVGIDVSYCQDGIDEDTSGVNWTEAATHNSFAIIRCSIGETMDRCLYSHYNKAKAAGMLVGFYHYLSENYPGRQQARFVSALTNDLDFDLPVALDVEAQGLTKQQVMDFVARWKELTIEPLAIYTSRTAWNRIVGPGAQPWAAGGKLWVADARDVPAPALPDPWVTWEFWQYGVKAGPEYPSAIDRNRFRGTIADLENEYGDWLVPPAPPTDIRVTYEPGGPYIIGSFKVADVWLLRYDPWDNPEQCLTGSKPEHGPAGFTFSVPNPGMYELTDGFTSWDVEARSGFTTRVVWA
jgi:GH25 family lysozyme M1 (1,4-beta-N-acetylmuramidase)